MNLAWFTFLCAEEGGKVPMTFVMQALECGHLTSSIVSGSLASRPVAAFVLLCGICFIHFALTSSPLLSICRVCWGISSSFLLSHLFFKIRSHLFTSLLLF